MRRAPKQKFGARKHTKKKLDVLDDYLSFFPTALKTKGYRLLYVDAFAGTGEVLLSESEEPLLPGIAPERDTIEGSAVRALKAAVPFDEYIFIEKNQSKLDTLAGQLRRQFPERFDRCRFICEDANSALTKICTTFDWRKYRAVVFLDPFGNQIAFDTLESIARTRAADVWYLFPAGLGVYRQIPRKGKTPSKAAESVTRMLGSNEWMFLFTKQSEADTLFGAEADTTRSATVAAITAHAIARLETIFQGGVLKGYVPLGGRTVPWYSLLFACSNPNAAAKKLAHRVAAWIVDHAD